jgi:hypothetical protein
MEALLTSLKNARVPVSIRAESGAKVGDQPVRAERRRDDTVITINSSALTASEDVAGQVGIRLVEELYRAATSPKEFHN